MSDEGPRMLRALWSKSLWEQRRSLLMWGLALVGITLMMSAFWPSLRDQAEDMQKLLDSYPEAFKAFFAADDLTTPEGYFRGELYSAMLPLLLLVYAIGRAADTIAGEEERGALDVLVALPLSRRRIVLEKAAAIALGVLALAAIIWASTAVGSLAFGVGLDLANVAAATLMLALFAIAFAFLALAVAALRGRKGLAVGVAAGVAVLSFLLNSFANLIDWLDRARWVSPFAYYSEGDPLKNGMDWVGGAVLLALAAVFLAVALWGFERRDVGV